MSNDLSSVPSESLRLSRALSRAASRSAQSVTAQLAGHLAEASPARRMAPPSGTFNTVAAQALTRWKDA
jgi:hypothetical protein